MQNLELRSPRSETAKAQESAAQSRSTRKGERQRRRAIVRRIRWCEARLIEKYKNSPALAWQHPGWNCENAAAEVEAHLGLQRGSMLRYFALIQHRASFLARFDWCPPRRVVAEWESYFEGPSLP